MTPDDERRLLAQGLTWAEILTAQSITGPWFEARGAWQAARELSAGDRRDAEIARLTRERDEARAEVAYLEQQVGECSGGYQTLERDPLASKDHDLARQESEANPAKDAK